MQVLTSLMHPTPAHRADAAEFRRLIEGIVHGGGGGGGGSGGGDGGGGGGGCGYLHPNHLRDYAGAKRNAVVSGKQAAAAADEARNQGQLNDDGGARRGGGNDSGDDGDDADPVAAWHKLPALDVAACGAGSMWVRTAAPCTLLIAAVRHALYEAQSVLRTYQHADGEVRDASERERE